MVVLIILITCFINHVTSDPAIIKREPKIMTGDGPNSIIMTNTTNSMDTSASFQREAAPKSSSADWERTLSTALHVPATVLLAVALVTTVVLLRHEKPSAHSRALACHTAALLVATALQLWLSSRKHSSDVECYASLLTYQFSYLASYFWLNAMCVDIYLAFRDLTGSSISESKRFVGYSVFAWGFPIVVVGVTAAAQFASSNEPPPVLLPFNDKADCSFHTNEALFLYLYGPVSVLLVLNLLLFVLTARSIHRLHRDTAILYPDESDSSLCGQGRVSLYVRLLWSMGVIEMVVELVSWDQSGSELSLCIRSVVDLCRAVSVFIVCCFRRDALRILCGLPPRSRSNRQSMKATGVRRSNSLWSQRSEKKVSSSIGSSLQSSRRSSQIHVVTQQLSVATIESLIVVLEEQH